MNITQKADDKGLDFRKKKKEQIKQIFYTFFLASNIKVYAYLD